MSKRHARGPRADGPTVRPISVLIAASERMSELGAAARRSSALVDVPSIYSGSSPTRPGRRGVRPVPAMRKIGRHVFTPLIMRPRAGGEFVRSGRPGRWFQPLAGRCSLYARRIDL